MKASRDYYEILGLPTDASLQDVKKRFRELALRYHPDRNPGDLVSEETFKLVAEAYHVLSNQKRRHLYDHEGHQGLREKGYKGFARTEDVLKTFASEFFQFLDIGGVRLPGGPFRGADLCYQLELSCEEAAAGIKKTLQINTMQTCLSCQGNGVKPVSTVQTCPRCQGSGRYSETSTIYAAAGICPKCSGKGSGKQAACNSCDGHGRLKVKKDLRVNIPAGVQNNTRLKISDEGDAGEICGKSGDLFLLLNVRQKPTESKAQSSKRTL